MESDQRDLADISDFDRSHLQGVFLEANARHEDSLSVAPSHDELFKSDSESRLKSVLKHTTYRLEKDRVGGRLWNLRAHSPQLCLLKFASPALFRHPLRRAALSLLLPKPLLLAPPFLPKLCQGQNRKRSTFAAKPRNALAAALPSAKQEATRSWQTRSEERMCLRQTILPLTAMDAASCEAFSTPRFLVRFTSFLDNRCLTLLSYM
jgi:hypothetical protein